MTETKRKVCTKCRHILPADTDHFYLGKNERWSTYCIKCTRITTKKFKKKNKDKVRISNLKYLETENGYFREKFHSVKRSRHGNNFKNFEEFMECWENQKAKYGWKCPYYPWMTMTIERGKGLKDKVDTNVSVDRILSDFPYSKDNVMFISWEANSKKGYVDPYLATKYLDFVNANEKARRLTETKIFLDIDRERMRAIDDIITIGRFVDGINKKIDNTREAHNKIYKPLIEADLVSYESEEQRKELRQAWGIEDEEETKH